MRRGWGSKNYRENVLAAIVTVYLYSNHSNVYQSACKIFFGFTYVFKGKPKHSKLTNEVKIYYVCNATIKHNVCVLS